MSLLTVRFLSEEHILKLITDGNESDIGDFYDEYDVVKEGSSSSENEIVPYSVTKRQERYNSPSLHQHSTEKCWKNIPFCEKPHSYPVLPKNPVRTPTDYLRDYFDDDFFEETAKCTNIYHMHKTGKDLNATKAEIARVFGVHIVMGCLPYPQLSMYWKTSTKMRLIADKISRDRFQTLRNALHVVDHDQPTEIEKGNPLWKVQPIIKRVQDACNKLERVPSYYSIDEQVIPLTDRCFKRQARKKESRSVGLKNFILTTSEGLVIDFDIYKGDKTMFAESSLGLGPSVVLHLTKSVPPGSCVYHGRYFTTVSLVEEMARRNIHSTGKIMYNRITDRTSCSFKEDSDMTRGESQYFTRNSTVIVKWKDNKSVIMASNCTGPSTATEVKRWSKKEKRFIRVPVPRVIQQYNEHAKGVLILNQQIKHYRAINNTKKWTLKVLLYFMDLALVNSWRLYSNDCLANGYPARNILSLLNFRLNVADALANIPEKDRRYQDSDSENEWCTNKPYRPIRPSQGKRYDGYDHLAVFDNIKSPRACLYETCQSRSKIKCSKCSVYLCLSRSKNCFQSYHTKS